MAIKLLTGIVHFRQDTLWLIMAQVKQTKLYFWMKLCVMEMKSPSQIVTPIPGEPTTVTTRRTPVSHVLMSQVSYAPKLSFKAILIFRIPDKCKQCTLRVSINPSGLYIIMLDKSLTTVTAFGEDCNFLRGNLSAFYNGMGLYK